MSIAAAAAPTTEWLGVSRYAGSVAAELAVIDPSQSRTLETLLDVAWHFMGLVKLRGHDLLFCPAAATCSWDLVRLKRDRSVRFIMLDDTPRQLAVVASPPSVSVRDLEWVGRYYDAALRMRDFQASRRFGLAFNLAYTFNHTNDPRVAIAAVWAGLDALFGERTDRPVSERLAERLAAWLGDVTATEILDLYALRCDAVHGRWLVSDAATLAVLRSSLALLRRSLAKAIERETPTLPDWR